MQFGYMRKPGKGLPTKDSVRVKANAASAAKAQNKSQTALLNIPNTWSSAGVLASIEQSG